MPYDAIYREAAPERADLDTGVYVDPAAVRAVAHRGPQFDVRGPATLPAGPQGYPVLLQAGGNREKRLRRGGEWWYSGGTTRYRVQRYCRPRKSQAALAPGGQAAVVPR